MKYKPFNINHNVKVKLTSSGLQRYHDWFKEVGITEVRTPRVDDNGYATFQMWNFMQIFGETMYMGNVNPSIDTEILIEFREETE
ncbi:hypothetical protein HB884_16925 [Listeria booriae]|uniref:hypothetical protein n=1 Tax=Listeria booriae TaxID=1552123 RepID=UPI00162960AA|nr:hypothetical protein [Listeria booriae]MBC1525886.1 hypothetical protein [Listeria booriae]